MAAIRLARAAWRCLRFLSLLAAAIPLDAADLTPVRVRFELALPVDRAALPSGAYLVSGVLTAGGAPLGSFVRIPRLRLPCPKPPCAATVQAEIPFKSVTEAFLRSFIDGDLEVEARTAFRPAGGGGKREAVLPMTLTAAALGLDIDALVELVRMDSPSLNLPAGELRLNFLFHNPFGFPARLARLQGKVNPGTRNAYPFEEAPDLALPPGETLHETTVKIKAEDLLIIASRKVVTEQYTLAVEAGIEGTLTVEIAGRTVRLDLPGR